MTLAFYARVRGRVQGVGFRYSAVRAANRFTIHGWVRNSADGAVEVWAEGAPENLDLFLAWLRKGPQFSRIDAVDTQDMEPRSYTDFTVEY